MPVRGPVYQPMEYEDRFKIVTPYIHEALSELQAKQDKARELVAQSSILPEEYVDPIGRQRYEQFVNEQASKLLTNTGGDLARNYQSVLQTIKGIKNSPYLGLNKQQLEESDLQRKLSAQYGPNTIILNDVTKQSLIDKDGNWISPGSLKSNVVNAEEFYKASAMHGKGLSDKMDTPFKVSGPHGELLERVKGFGSPEEAYSYAMNNKIPDVLYRQYGYDENLPEATKKVIKEKLLTGFVDASQGERITMANPEYINAEQRQLMQLRQMDIEDKIAARKAKLALQEQKLGRTTYKELPDALINKANTGNILAPITKTEFSDTKEVMSKAAQGDKTALKAWRHLQDKAGKAPEGSEVLNELPTELLSKVGPDKLSEIKEKLNTLALAGDLKLHKVQEILANAGIIEPRSLEKGRTSPEGIVMQSPVMSYRPTKYTTMGIDANNPYGIPAVSSGTGVFDSNTLKDRVEIIQKGLKDYAKNTDWANNNTSTVTPFTKSTTQSDAGKVTSKVMNDYMLNNPTSFSITEGKRKVEGYGESQDVSNKQQLLYDLQSDPNTSVSIITPKPNRKGMITYQGDKGTTTIESDDYNLFFNLAIETGQLGLIAESLASKIQDYPDGISLEELGMGKEGDKRVQNTTVKYVGDGKYEISDGSRKDELSEDELFDTFTMIAQAGQAKDIPYNIAIDRQLQRELNSKQKLDALLNVNNQFPNR